MDRLLIIFCGFVAAAIGAGIMVYALQGDGTRTVFWIGVLVGCLGGALATLARQLPRSSL